MCKLCTSFTVQVSMLDYITKDYIRKCHQNYKIPLGLSTYCQTCQTSTMKPKKGKVSTSKQIKKG